MPNPSNQEKAGGVKPSRRKPATLLAVGIVFILGPLWGTLGSVASVAGAFDRGTRGAEAALNISVSLWTTVIGWAMTPIGVVMVCIALVRIFRGGSETSSS